MSLTESILLGHHLRHVESVVVVVVVVVVKAVAVPPVGVVLQEGEVVVGVSCHQYHLHCITRQTWHAYTSKGNNALQDATTTYTQSNLSQKSYWESFTFKSGLNRLKAAG